MEIGKVSTDVLKKVIFSNIKHKRQEVLVRPNIGEDCAVVDFGEYACVMSTDPITGAAKDIGGLAVHISCNDIASSGVEPIGIMLTIMAPPDTTEDDLRIIMEDANKAAASVNVEIIGGHTEITDAVNRVIISATAIGRQPKESLILSKGAKLNDAILMTKHAGLEGIAIIARELEDKLTDIVGKDTVMKAQKFYNDISVVNEGVLAGEIGVNSMHDVTEGGILGAVWEIGEASDFGVEIYEADIALRDETREICDVLSINPYRLISSGSLIIAVSQEKKMALMNAFVDKGLEIHEIGKVVEGESRVIGKDRKVTSLAPPDVDELYKALKYSYDI